MSRIELAPGISIAAEDIEVSFIASSGPGGQNVNKVATAAQLRFNLAATDALSGPAKYRLAQNAGSKLTQFGEIIITARRFRSQEQNRADAYARLAEMIAEARIAPVKRIKTRVGAGAKARRMDAKSHRGNVKRHRGKVEE
jgi:ribosome-associated protein